MKKRKKSQNEAGQFTLTDEEVAKLIDCASTNRNRLIVKTLVKTGLRRAELCGLDTQDLQPDRGRIIVRHGKGDKRRFVPIPDSLAAELRAFVERRVNGPLFRSQREGRLVPRTINHIIKAAADIAKITNPNPDRKQIGPHLLRHTFSRHYLRDGGRLHILSQILGHANIAITHAVYGTASEDEIQEEYRKVVE